jgi:co-chaperonin GroES (HSP10)
MDDSLSERGVRMGNELLEFVPENTNIRPLRDQIIVEPLPASESIILDVWKPIRGKVLAVGKGCYPIRYNGPKGKRTKSWSSKALRPCDVKVGDIVELGGKEIGGYLHCSIRWGTKEVILCREEDVAGIVSANN